MWWQLQNLYWVAFFLQLYQVSLRSNAGSSKDKRWKNSSNMFLSVHCDCINFCLNDETGRPVRQQSIYNGILCIASWYAGSLEMWKGPVSVSALNAIFRGKMVGNIRPVRAAEPDKCCAMSQAGLFCQSRSISGHAGHGEKPAVGETPCSLDVLCCTALSTCLGSDGDNHRLQNPGLWLPGNLLPNAYGKWPTAAVN